MNQKPGQIDFTRAVRAYHRLPMVVAILLVGIFVSVFYITGSTMLSGILSGIPSIILIWYWTKAGRRVDQEVCPNCGHDLRNELPWIYPSRKYPTCSERVL
jgi:hypothetical protein